MKKFLDKIQNFSIDDNVIFYVNMTDGLEFIPIAEKLNIPLEQIHFSSIQSTHLEQKTFDPMLNRLGADFLMNLALGKTCIVVDFGTDKTISRAIYQGIPFIKYCLEKAWFGYTPKKVFIQAREYTATPQDVTELYAKWYHQLNRRTKSYLKKFKRYALLKCPNNQINLEGISNKTQHDGDLQYYEDIVEKYL